MCIRDSHQSSEDTEATHAFALTGGPDGKIRFWDCDRLDGSRVVSGGAPGDKPAYTMSQLGMDTRVYTEKMAEDESSGGTNAIESSKVTSNNSAKRAASVKPSSKPSRYEAIRMSAQQLLEGHLDTITDVALLERPYGMVLSADRSGQVFVHQ